MLREIVDLGRLRQAAQKSALQRHFRQRFLVGLIGGEPEILAERIVIAVDADLSRRAEKSAEAVFADEIRAVEMIVAHARAREHEAVARSRSGKERAERRGSLRGYRRREAGIECRRAFARRAMCRRDCERAISSCMRAQSLIVIFRGFQGRTHRRSLRRGRIRRRRAAGTRISGGVCRHGRKCERREQSSQRNQCARANHCAAPCFELLASGSCAGGGSIGGLSVDVSFFCTSSSEIKIAGAAAATGTDPDSAPQ